jgi:hypothetical protein
MYITSLSGALEQMKKKKGIRLHPNAYRSSSKKYARAERFRLKRKKR